ncbi:MAG: hypothetical protein AAGA42_20015 [Actinomycetota bacterium]
MLRHRLLATLCGAALVAASCAENEPDSATDSTASESVDVDDTASATTDAPSASTDTTLAPTTSSATDSGATDDDTVEAGTDSASVASELQWAIDYIGATPGPVDGDTVKVGVAGAFDFLQLQDDGAQVAVDFVNAQLGGVGGRPVELALCNIAAPEDGGACAAEFANDPDVVAVLAAGALDGTADLYAGLAGQKPVLQSAPLGIADFTTDAAPSYNAGALGAASALGLFALDFAPQTVALVITDDAAGRAGQSITAPIIEGSGAELRTVFVAPTATAPEIQSALQASGANDVDVIVSGLFEQGCIALIDALASSGIDTVATPLLSSSTCWGNVVQEHQANIGAEYAWPNGWYFSWGYNPWQERLEDGTSTYVAAMEAAGFGDEMFDAAAGDLTFAGVLSMVRALNAVDGDYSFEAVDAELRGWTGPHMLQAGPLACGQSEIFRAVCPNQIGMWQFLDGEWLDATVVDISPVLSG